MGDNSTRDFIHFDSFEEDPKTFVFDYRFIHNKVLSGFFGVIWTKFYKKSFLEDNNIGFPSHKLYNDLEFHIKSVLLAKRIAVVWAENSITFGVEYKLKNSMIFSEVILYK